MPIFAYAYLTHLGPREISILDDDAEFFMYGARSGIMSKNPGGVVSWLLKAIKYNGVRATLTRNSLMEDTRGVIIVGRYVNSFKEGYRAQS